VKPLRFTTILLYALVMGVFWGTWFSQSRTMDALSAATFLENGRMYIANLAGPMRLLMPGSLVLTFVTAYLSKDRRSWAYRGTLAAGLLMLAALAITLAVNVPIDNQIKAWTLESLPKDWEAIRDRWETFHVLRTWISIAGFSCLVGGSLTES
jgi:hypothetical protein